MAIRQHLFLFNLVGKHEKSGIIAEGGPVTDLMASQNTGVACGGQGKPLATWQTSPSLSL